MPSLMDLRLDCFMPLHSLVELELSRLPNQRMLLHTAIHGLIHQILTLVPSEPDSEVNPATRLHESQRQALSLRGFELDGIVLRLELVTLSDDLVAAVRFAFQAPNRFGQDDDVLQGVVRFAFHTNFLLQQIFHKIQAQRPASFLRLEFLSPTAFTHKRGTWASPHPTLLLDSLLARWLDFGGDDLQVNHQCIVKAAPLIQTSMTSIGSSQMHSFKGQLDLELAGTDQDRWILTTLLAFGCIANVGRRVAYGCGSMRSQVRSGRSEFFLEPSFLVAMVGLEPTTPRL